MLSCSPRSSRTPTCAPARLCSASSWVSARWSPRARQTAWASLAVPDGYPALLGVIPLALGLHKLWGLRRTGDTGDDDGGAEVATRGIRSQVLTIAGVTIANGGDNLGVYIPLFAREPSVVPLYAIVFAAMTAVWCLAAHRLVTNRLVGAQIRRYGQAALPIVLIALGLWILAGARVLLG